MVPTGELITPTLNPARPRLVEAEEVRIKEGLTDQLGARLLHFYNRWSCLPPSYRRFLQRGYHWEWVSSPPICQVPRLQQQSERVQGLVELMLEKGAAYEVPPQPCFLANIFAIPKSSGGDRLILDVSLLNSFIALKTFKMTGHGCFKKTLEAPSWMCSLDIQDAYLHIPIAKHLHRYLAFTAMGKLYFFRALPFGLAPAPWLFTRLLDFVIKGFQRQGHKVLAYLDDLIIWNTCPSTTASSAKYIQTQLEFLGFRINLEKSSLVPRQELTWLGISWDSRTGSCVLPLQKRQEIASVATKLFLSPLVSRRQWERFTGLVTFAAQVSAQAKLRSHEVACPQRIALPEQRDVPHPLPKSLRAVLSDWMHPSFLDIPDRLYLAPPSLTIWTDASLSGW